MWLGRILYRYPIENIRGFVSAWNRSPASVDDSPRIGPLMLPFYIAAIKRTQEDWSDWHFNELMRAIAAHQNRKSRATVRALIEKLLMQPLNLSRRKEVISSAKKFGDAGAGKLEGKYFDALLNDYFIRPIANRTNNNDAVDITFHQPKYLRKLRNYYLKHTMTFDVEEFFLGRVKQYSGWPGYDIMAPAVEQGRKRNEYRQGLLRKCMEMRPLSDDKLLPILQARLETDAQAKFQSDPSRNRWGSCIDASLYWINGDEATIKARAALMLAAAEKNKKFSRIVLEVLNYKFEKNFNSLKKWESWWSIYTRPAASPFGYKQYRISYDVKLDGTYTALVETVMSVETEFGIQIAQHYLLASGEGIKNGKKEVDILTAYTLKENGKKIEAIRLNPQDEKLPGAGGIMQMPADDQAKMVAFQDVAVGDDLIFSYKVIRKVAVSPGNVSLTQILSEGESVVSLSAPATMNLRIEAAGIKAVKATEIGGVKNWVWKYQGKKAGDLQTRKPVPFKGFPIIHISSFKDQAAETAASMPKSPLLKDQATETTPSIPKQLTPEERFAEWRKDAGYGKADAQFQVGYAYDVGIGVTKDAAKAIEWFEKSAAQGYSRAQLMLGQDYFFGKWGKREIAKGAEWYQKAVSQAGVQGDPAVETRIGLEFEKGKEVPKDAVKAVEWYQRAAAQGYGLAQFYLSLMYENGNGVAKDAAKAEEWFQKAAAHGRDDGIDGLNTYPYLSLDPAKSMEWFKRDAERGNANAQVQVGFAYDFGIGVTKDSAKAFEWYQKAVSQAGVKFDPAVETRIGLEFEKGKEVPRDAVKAVEWYQRAAAQGYGLAQFYLSLMYEKGNGVAKDAAKAEEWFQKAAAYGWEKDKDGLNKFTTLSPDRDKSVEWFKRGAERGNADAQYRLGEIYGSWMHEIYGYGNGVDNDNDKAFEWYRKAAEQGHVKAQYSMGEMYRHGNGVAADADKAVEWFQKSAAHADAQMQKHIKETIEEMYEQGEVSTRNGAASQRLSPDSDIRLITATSIGPVKLGMRLHEAKNALPATAKFARTENAEGLALISVEIGNEDLMILYAGEEHFDSPIDWSRRIENIETFDPECHTAEGVHPYSLVRDIEKVYGKTKRIMVSEIESREYIDFEKQPKHFLIRSDYIGIFPTDNSRITTKFKPEGAILSIAISSN